MTMQQDARRWLDQQVAAGFLDPDPSDDNLASVAEMVAGVFHTTKKNAGASASPAPSRPRGLTVAKEGTLHARHLADTA